MFYSIAKLFISWHEITRGHLLNLLLLSRNEGYKEIKSQLDRLI